MGADSRQKVSELACSDEGIIGGSDAILGSSYRVIGRFLELAVLESQLSDLGQQLFVSERDVADLDWQRPKCARVIPEFPTLG